MQFCSSSIPQLQLFGKLFLRDAQCHLNDLVHIVVFVLAQAAAEDDPRLRVGQLLVGSIQGAVLFIIDGVVRLVALFPLRTVLPADNGLGLSAKLKVLDRKSVV